MSGAPLPIVVVGGGVAGMAVALAAAPRAVRLLCRSVRGVGSASALAQGGIAAALGPGDSATAHAEDTLSAGAQHNDRDAVRWLTAQAPATIAWLQAQGVAFDRAADGSLQWGREGGHGCSRIVHAGGDATGAALVYALGAQLAMAGHVEINEGVDAEALMLRDGRVVGVRVRAADDRVEEIEAGAVVLATGGLGALFARTSNPPAAEGSGLALALAAGAAARDLEFVQFHPTALLTDGHSLPLLTEALRGAGARLQDDAGRPLMRGLHPLGDLAPRDVVARRVWQARQTGEGAWLDATGIAGDLGASFPTVLAACLTHGFDPRRAPLPITPAAHFHMGGVAVDMDGQTSLPGLHAVGEVACNGVHGANRLASNSLLEGVAFGRRLGARLTVADAPPARGSHHWIERGEPLADAAMAGFRDWLWTAAGPVREGAALEHARRLCTGAAEAGWQVRLAALLLQAMCRREASLGAHWRAEAQVTALTAVAC